MPQTGVPWDLWREMQFSSTFQQVPLMVVSSDTVTAGLTLTATRIFIFLSLSLFFSFCGWFGNSVFWIRCSQAGWGAAFENLLGFQNDF